MKYCKDCKWALPFKSEVETEQFRLATCRHPKALNNNGDCYTHPNIAPKFYFCAAMRVGSDCGAEGKLWEPAQSVDSSDAE